MTTPTLPQGWGMYGGVRVSPLQRQAVISAQNQGASATATQRAMSSAGLGLRRQAILQIRAELSGAPARAKDFNSIRLDFKPDPNRLQTTRRNIATKYSYWGRISGVIRETGEAINLNVNFGSDELLTRRGIIEEFSRIAEAYEEQYDAELDAPNITDIVQAGLVV